MSVLPDASEAAADALIARMISFLPQLNARLASPGLPALATVTSAQIQLGDPDTLPASAAMPFWFAFVGGDADSGVEIAPKMMTAGDDHPYENPYFATISAYVHPQTVLDPDPHGNEAIRHRLLSRLSGWLRADVLNTQDGLIISIASQEYSSGSATDQLRCGSIRRIRRADAMKGVARSIAVPCMRHDFEGVIH